MLPAAFLDVEDCVTDDDMDGVDFSFDARPGRSHDLEPMGSYATSLRMRPHTDFQEIGREASHPQPPQPMRVQTLRRDPEDGMGGLSVSELRDFAQDYESDGLEGQIFGLLPVTGHTAPPLEWAGTLTIMMRNLPNKYSQRMLLAEINHAGFLGTFDFVYLPIDPETNANRGYAFLNFVSPSVAWVFKSFYDGRKMNRFNSSKVVSVMPAALQGFEANYAHYANARVNRGNLAARPLFLRLPKQSVSNAPVVLSGARRNVRRRDRQNTEDHPAERLETKPNYHHAEGQGQFHGQSHDQQQYHSSSWPSHGGVEAYYSPQVETPTPMPMPSSWPPERGGSRFDVEVPDLVPKFCPHCGGHIQAKFQFCPSCGATLDFSSLVRTDESHGQSFSS